MLQNLGPVALDVVSTVTRALLAGFREGRKHAGRGCIGAVGKKNEGRADRTRSPLERFGLGPSPVRIRGLDQPAFFALRASSMMLL